MSYCELKTESHLEYSQLLEEFYKGCKTTEKIGMEYERIPIIKSNGEVASYYGDNGICEFLKEFAKTYNWDYILDDINIIGLKKSHDTITLEPGSQVELSITPEEYIKNLKKKIEDLDKKFEPILEKMGIELINKGVSPLTTYKNIKLIPKRRYVLMANYLWGILSDVMMRETAGIQVGIDYKSEADAMKKFKVSNLMMPFLTAMFANSEIRGGVNTGYKSFRALAWLNTDNDRCGFATKFEDGITFRDYVNKLLDVPMIFINREGHVLGLNGSLTFKQFMENGYEGFNATLEDWKLHSNLYFPEIRLRSFIEIRNHDCVGGDLKYSIPAFYKGIMYSPEALNEVEIMLEKYSYNEINELRYNVAKKAINSKIRKTPIIEICKELVEISYYSLKNMCCDEEQFLVPLVSMLKNKKIPADL